MQKFKLYNDDCLNVLRRMRKNSVQAVIIDPPFGTSTAEWDVEPREEVFKQLQRVCPDGPIAIFGYAKNLFKWATYIQPPLKLQAFIVWHKKNEPVVGPGLTRMHQDIVIWSRSIKSVRADRVREPYTSGKVGAKMYSSLSHSEFGKRLGKKNWGQERNPDGRRCSDVWEMDVDIRGFSHFGHRRHPNQKPLAVLDRLVRLLTDDEDTVLDCFMGSGVTGIACLQNNRRFIGVELVKKYFVSAKQELEEVSMGRVRPRIIREEPNVTKRKLIGS